MTRSCPVLGIGVDVTGLWRWRSLLLREPDVVDVAFSEQERAWVRGVLREHVAEHFPELQAP